VVGFLYSKICNFQFVFNFCFKPERQEISAGWGTIHNEVFHHLYSLPNYIRVISSRGMGKAGHIGRMGEMRNAYRILVRRPEEKIQFGRLSTDERIILKWMKK
jgi:hypothetical protein